MNAEPEWTERAEKRGLDPLGIQNPGIQLYQALLPGISNVTLRIRYYGYYCWISDAYARSDATTEFAAWRTWVRRAEALYALACARATGQGGVGGIDWANRRLEAREDVIDFAEAASTDSSVERYLRQSLGVFGGAYYSQMVEVGLFRQGEHGIQRATNGAGRTMAEAFRESIGPEVDRLLIDGIMSALIARDDLDRLSAIIPSAIPELSPERLGYEQVLFGSSNPLTPNDISRTASLKLILSAADSLRMKPDAEDIRWHLFSAFGFDDDGLEAQRVRWEAYQCQDLMQVAAAALLVWSTDLMAQVDGGRTLAEIGTEIRAKLTDSEPNQASANWSAFRAGVDPDRYDYRSAWSQLTSRRGTAEGKAWDAVGLMAALHQRISERSELRASIQQGLGVQGNGRSLVSELAWLARREEEEVGNVIAAYVERLVRRHSWVAMQKLRRQRDYTFLFEVRDGRFIRRKAYQPVATTPRLSPAIQFLEDIGLVDSEGITARGRALLGVNA